MAWWHRAGMVCYTEFECSSPSRWPSSSRVANHLASSASGRRFDSLSYLLQHPLSISLEKMQQ